MTNVPPPDLMAPHREALAWHESAMANARAMREAAAIRDAARASTNVVKLADYRPTPLRLVISDARIV